MFLESIITSDLTDPEDDKTWVEYVLESLQGMNFFFSGGDCAADAADRIATSLEHSRLRDRILKANSSNAGVDNVSPLEPGTACMVRLDLDGDWHEGVIEGCTVDSAFSLSSSSSSSSSSPSSSSSSSLKYSVRILQYNVVQMFTHGDIVPMDDVIDDDDEDENEGSGPCELCSRALRLTRHHLRPRSEHARLAKKIPRAVLELTCSICRGCHNAVHRAESNSSLANSFFTLDALRGHEAIVRWVKYAQSNARMTPWDTAVMRSQGKRV